MSDHNVQGSAAWLAFRKTRITATDAVAIMGASKYKTVKQLYIEKTTDVAPMIPNKYMQRGIDLEPVARELLSLALGIPLFPKVVLGREHDWMMASLDGISEDGNTVIERKCPNKKCQLAYQGQIPDWYYPQVQHQMSVTGVDKVYYYSFDGIDGDMVIVPRDDAYISVMIEKEKEFYNCMMAGISPE